MIAEADKRHIIATASKVETRDESQQQFPAHRICTIKMFLILFLQATLQTFSCSYVSKKWEKEQTLKTICWISCFSLLLCIVICSIFGTKMRKRSYISIPLFFIYCISLEGAVIYLGMRFFTPDHAMMSSIMQLSIFIGLCCYSCCLKEHITTLYSHIWIGLMLLASLGCSIALFTDYYMYLLVSAACVAAWASFVVHNLMALSETLEINESFYAALIV